MLAAPADAPAAAVQTGPEETQPEATQPEETSAGETEPEETQWHGANAGEGA